MFDIEIALDSLQKIKAMLDLINLPRQTSISVPICPEVLTVGEKTLTNPSFFQGVSTKFFQPGTKTQYSERNFEYSKSIFDYSESIASNTFPANRHPPPCCRLDTSLLSTGQQGAERL